MPAITSLRSSIATALTDNSKYSVFSFPPATPIANSVIVTPDDPYIVPSNNDYSAISPMANFKISILVPLLDNEGNLAGIEADVVRVFALLEASSIVFNVGSVSAPSVLSIASGDLLTCDIAISTLTEWSYSMDDWTKEQADFLIKIGQLPATKPATQPTSKKDEE